MIYAIGDVHGCANELRQLLNMLPLTPDSTVVFLGDYVDRGSESREVIDTILQLKRYCNVVTLMGNHEAMFLDFLDRPGTERAGLFICNGGSATLASYADEFGNYEFPPEHLEFLRNLEVFFEDERHFFVHGGVPTIPLDQIDVALHKKKLMWIRGPFLNTEFEWSKIIVHGHTPVRRVDIRHNRINVDTGCVFMRSLSAIALPGQQVFSVPRQPGGASVYLRDIRSRRLAIRFQGALPVEVQRDGRSFQFETIDYSEVGLYMRDLERRDRQVFQQNDRVQGRIGSNGAGSVNFWGQVVRMHQDDIGVHYAVKIERMDPTEEVL